MKRIPWKTLWQGITRLPSVAAEHAFPFTLFLIAVAAIFSLFLFTIYGFSPQTKYVGPGESSYDVKEELFLDVVTELERRGLNLENVNKGTPRDIFNSVD